jgi:hypothetical protein
MNFAAHCALGARHGAIVLTEAGRNDWLSTLAKEFSEVAAAATDQAMPRRLNEIADDTLAMMTRPSCAEFFIDR